MLMWTLWHWLPCHDMSISSDRIMHRNGATWQTLTGAAGRNRAGVAGSDLDAGRAARARSCVLEHRRMNHCSESGRNAAAPRTAAHFYFPEWRKRNRRRRRSARATRPAPAARSAAVAPTPPDRDRTRPVTVPGLQWNTHSATPWIQLVSVKVEPLAN